MKFKLINFRHSRMFWSVCTLVLWLISLHTIAQEKIIYFDDFESDNGGFIVAGTNPSWTYKAPAGGAWSGTKAWDQDGYATLANETLTSPYIVLPPDHPDSLIYISFYLRSIVVNTWAGATLEVSKNNENIWSKIDGFISGDYDPVDKREFGGTEVDLPYWTGNKPWTFVSADITHMIADSIRFRIRFRSSSLINNPQGFTLDDVKISQVLDPNPIPHFNDFESGEGEYAKAGTISTWAVGTPPGGAKSGAQAWFHSPVAIKDADNSWMTPHYFVPTSPSGQVIFSFDQDLNMVNNPYTDYATLEIQFDGGSWQYLNSFLSGSYNGTINTTAVWRGIRDWTRVKVNVSSYAGSRIRFRVRYVIKSSSPSSDGISIDNVSMAIENNMIPTLSVAPSASTTYSDFPLHLTLNFSEPVAGLEIEELDIPGAYIQNLEAINAAEYTIEVFPHVLGSLTLNLGAGSVLDYTGNPNLAGSFELPYSGCSTYANNNVSIAVGEVYSIGANNYNNAGTYFDTILNHVLCDSLVKTVITLGPANGSCGTVLNFDGDNDLVTLPNNLTIGNISHTVEMWVKIPEVGSGGLASGERVGAILGNYNATPNSIYEVHAKGEMRIWWNEGQLDLKATTDLRDNQWHHLAYVRNNADNTFKAYIDGELELSHTSAGSNLIFAHPHNIGGDRRAPSSSPNFHGDLEELKIWDFAMTQEEIQESITTITDPTSAGLLHYWDFNDGRGALTLTDLAGGNNGTLTDMDAANDWLSADGELVGQLYYTDVDGDGYVGDEVLFCSDPGAAYYLESELTSAGKLLGDCDDADQEVNPGEVEIEGNAKDDDCNAATPDVIIEATTLLFDGTDDFVSASGPNLASQSFSIEFWAQRSEINKYGMVLFMGSNATGQGLNIPIMDNNKVRFSFYGTDFDSNITIVDTDWHHFAMTYNHANGAYSIYIDGALDKSGVFGTTFTGSNAMLIGRQLDNGSRFFKGKLDEFRIWDRALSSTEINGSIDCELNGDEVGLLAYYQFNQGIVAGDNSGIATLTDETGNEYTATLQNFALVGASSNWSDGSVISTACNIAPVLSAIGDKSVTIGEELAFTASATDEDSPTLTFSLDAAAESEGMTIDASTGAFSWTPMAGQAGSDQVTVTVSDGSLTDSETFSITVNKLDQIVTFYDFFQKTYGDAPFELSAESPSALSIIFTSSDETVATISGNILTIVGAGTTTLTALQAGNDNYNPASTIKEMVVAKSAQTINLPNIPDVNLLDSTSFTISISASSGLPVVLSIVDETVATISGGLINLLQKGVVSLLAEQGGDDNYHPISNSAIFQVFEKYVWNGTSWNAGAPNVNSTVLITGNFNSVTGGNLLSRDIEIAASATVTIEANTRMQFIGNLVNNGNIIVESGGTFFNYGLLNISGNPITFRRNTRYADGKYSFVGSPVQYDLNIVGSQLGANVYRYDESTDVNTESLSRWITADGDPLIPGKGYTQANQQLIEFVGMPNDGTITYSASHENDGWHLVSNPYPAALDLSAFLDANTNTTDAIYLWDDNGSEAARGTSNDYIIVNKTAATDNSGENNESRWNGYIGSMQGFFIQMDGAPGDIVFDENMRVIGSNNDISFFRKTVSDLPVARINLTTSDGLFEQTVIGWNEVVSDDELSEGYDARVFSTSADYLIYTTKANIPLAIQTVTSGKEVMPLGYQVAEAGNYTLGMDVSKAQGKTLYLHDLHAGRVTDLGVGAYDFSSAAGVFADRFELRTTGALLSNSVVQKGLYVKDKMLYITVSQPARYELLNLSGQRLTTALVNGVAVLDLNHLANGVYLINDGLETIKIILK